MTYHWYVNYNGGGWGAATTTQCVTNTGTASNGAALSCVTAAGVSTGSYQYEMVLTDSATSSFTTTSGASGTATINTVLSVSTSPSTQTIVQGGTGTITGTTTQGTPAYTWQWLASTTGSSPWTAAEANTLLGVGNGYAQSQNVVWTTTGSTSAGTYGFELQATDSASNTIIATNANIVVVAGCFTSLSPSTINFGSINPATTLAPANTVTDTNSGGAGAYIYVFGGNWVIAGTQTNGFGVSNTVWATSGIAPTTPLSATAANTGLLIPAGGSNTVYFGLKIPSAISANSYNSVITVDSSC